MKKFNCEQNFSFGLKINFKCKSNDYDEAMMKVIHEVNKINGGDVQIDEIKNIPGIISI